MKSANIWTELAGINVLEPYFTAASLPALISAYNEVLPILSVAIASGTVRKSGALPVWCSWLVIQQTIAYLPFKSNNLFVSVKLILDVVFRHVAGHFFNGKVTPECMRRIQLPTPPLIVGHIVGQKIKSE